ncbi:hypothetical protein UFOVP98_51 [uncultured Caudovirales phage]|uniref:DUF6948 domain-containing protein n=1 Tax=uncultured Caudovirales phage TaxID=2100421 RepID=A0A6J5LL38_9CAUD|nr:hypothetical protein UFOVP98_51 [uncultured Caudovirales phage]CAB4134182.1 hypothetical protein UFOVP269_19 [uncultured Caudovirales phage]
MNTNEIEINGEIYVKKECDPSKQYVIVRSYSAGVFAGYIESRNGQEVVMRNARRIWYWSGAASLSQLAMEGTSDPDSCKFPCEVDRVELLNVVEILTCTDKAQRSITEVKIWSQ